MTNQNTTRLTIPWPEGAVGVSVWFRRRHRQSAVLDHIELTGERGQRLFAQDLSPEIRTIDVGGKATFTRRVA